jgi:two-component system, NarL family, response regulator LiaR
MDKITVLIVDDHPMMREALRTALGEESDLDVIGEAMDGIQGVARFEELNPDIILMDLLLPGIDGVSAIVQIIANDPQAKILVVTSLEDQDHIMAAIQAGALGYFPKTAPRVHLLEAIHKVADGVPYMPVGITKKLFQGLREMKSYTPEPAGQKLTARQQQILVLLGEGKGDAEIATNLHISEATVRTHVHHILQRLDLETRSQAVAYANREGRQGEP